MRTFGEAIRGLDREAMEALLRERPDLTLPRPRDLTDLATRAATQTSVRRALERLDRLRLAVCEALAASPDPTDLTAVTDLLGIEGTRVAEAVADLRRLALVWGGEQELHLVRAARESFGTHPAGLAAPSPRPLSAEEVTAALTDLPENARTVLDRLAWGPPTGSVRNADRPVSTPTTPVEHLLQRGLLRPSGPDTVVLPREVALRWRGGFLREPLEQPEPLTAGSRSAALVDRAGVGAAYEIADDVAAVMDALDRRPPALLRDGGMALRDLQRLSRELGLEQARCCFVVELAHAADLLTAETHPRPSTAYDHWLTLATEDRVLALLRGWLRHPRWYAAARAAGAHPLEREAGALWAPDVREVLLEQLTTGAAVDAEAVTALLAWHRPGLTRFAPAAELVAETLQEATWLGLVALGQVTALARAAATGVLPETLNGVFPEPVTEVLLQADLTAVAPGPLDHAVAAGLALLADQESRGGGGVFRFSAESVRRAFDRGWGSEQVLHWLAEHAATEVPQPLAYLVADVARRHGTIRVGAVRAYVRVDDPAPIGVILAHPEAASLGLRQLGPQALVADADPDEVVELLRRLGLAPAAEDASGSVLAPPTPRRATSTRRQEPDLPDPAALAELLLERNHGGWQERGMRTEDTLAVLSAARQDTRPVEIDYVDAEGTAVTRRLTPVELSAGMVRLHGDAGFVTLPLSRVTAARG